MAVVVSTQALTGSKLRQTRLLQLHTQMLRGLIHGDREQPSQLIQVLSREETQSMYVLNLVIAWTISRLGLHIHQQYALKIL